MSWPTLDKIITTYPKHNDFIHFSDEKYHYYVVYYERSRGIDRYEWIKRLEELRPSIESSVHFIPLFDVGDIRDRTLKYIHPAHREVIA